jgi:23S rRNA pseudouridine1911/1915/1917 synthase
MANMPQTTFQNYHVKPEHANLTLAACLRQFLPGTAWNQIRRLLKSRHVQVNGNLCVDEARRLKDGDVIKVWEQPIAKPVEEDDVRICYVDAHVVVVEKPAGITTLRHSEERTWPQRRKQQQPTLDEVLVRLLAKKQGRHAGKQTRPPRLRAVHRLDRDTSGLMVFARTVPAERVLVQQFRQHTVHRKYIAVVHGEIKARTISSELVRDRGDGRRGSTTLKDVGQHAVTHVRPVESLPGYTVIECQLETGRTHQIRIHLAEAGHVLCGEKVYHQPLFGKPIPDRSGAPRQALHAAELGFDHPITGEKLHFKMPLPADLAEFLKRLNQQASSQKSRPDQRR